MVTLLNRRRILRVLGGAADGFAVSAAFVPSFSGLVTLPAMETVALAPGIELEDVVVVMMDWHWAPEESL